MDNLAPLISIIVPVYNVEQYLGRCVDSLIRQRFHNIEIILVDDGSPDNSGVVCDKYALMDTRIKVIHKENSGVNEARITGFKESRGEYITFVDSDDYVSPFYVERLYSSIIENNVVMTCVQRIYVKEGKEKYDIRPVSGYFDRNGIIEILKNNFLFDYKKNTNAYNLGLCCKMIKREYLQGAMENARNLWIGEDLITNLYVAYRIPSMFILEEYLYYYVQHDSQSTRNGSLEAWENQVEQWNRIVELDIEQYLKGQLPYRILMLAKLFVRNNVEQKTITLRMFLLNMKEALRYRIVEENFVNYHYPLLRKGDRLFVFLVRSGHLSSLYYLFKIALPLRRFLKAVLRRAL